MEKYNIEGNLVFEKKYEEFETDAESFIIDGDKILLTGGTKNDDTIDILTLNLIDGHIISRNKYFDPNSILLSPNPNDLIEYNGQYVLVSTSEIFEEIFQDRIIGTLYFINKDMTLDIIVAFEDFQGTNAYDAEIDSKGNLIVFTENRCGSCGGLLRSVITFDKNKKRLNTYNSEGMLSKSGEIGEVMKNDNRVFGFTDKFKVTVRCIDSIGNVLWNNNFDNPNEVRRYGHIQESQDGNIFVTGETAQPYQDNPGFDRVAYIQKIGQDGFPLWERTFSKDTRPIENYSYIYHMYEDIDKSLYLIGDFHNITTSDLLLIKTDSFGCVNTDKCTDHYLLNPPKGLHEYDQLNMRQKEWYYSIYSPNGGRRVEHVTFGRDSTFFDPDYGPDKFRAVHHTIDNVTIIDSFHMRWDYKGKAYFIEKWRFEKFGGEKPYDTLLYNFTLKKGDQFTLPRGFGMASVELVDSIDLLDGYKRKRIVLRHDSAMNQQKWGDLIWIEGIGSLNGLYYFNDCFHGTETSLNCYFDRDMKRYSQIGLAEDCDKPFGLFHNVISSSTTYSRYHFPSTRSSWITYTQDSFDLYGNFYHKQFESENMDATNYNHNGRYIRQKGNKVYEGFVDITPHDLLLYDFDLGVGDTIEVLMGALLQNVTCTKIDSVLLFDNQYRKRLEIKCVESDYKTYWIEGIGEIKFYEDICFGLEQDIEAKILCFYSSQKLIYMDSLDGNCWIVGVDDHACTNEIKISPNPATEHLNIIISPSANVSYNNTMIVEIYSALGANVLKQNILGSQNHVDISVLATGLYFIKVNKADATIMTSKFVKL